MAELDERVARMEGTLEQIDKRLGVVEADLRGIRTELQDLRGEIRTEIGSLRSEMRTEMGGMRSEIGSLRSGMGTEIGSLRSEMSTNFRWMVGLLIGVWSTMVLMWVTITLTMLLKVK